MSSSVTVSIRAACEQVRDVGQAADPFLRDATGRNIVGLRTPWFIGVPLAEYVRDRQRAGQALLPESRRAAHDAGQFFLTLEIAAKLNLPVVDDLKSQVNTRLPPALRADAKADWSQWPMRVKPSTPPGNSQY